MPKGIWLNSILGHSLFHLSLTGARLNCINVNTTRTLCISDLPAPTLTQFPCTENLGFFNPLKSPPAAGVQRAGGGSLCKGRALPAPDLPRPTLRGGMLNSAQVSEGQEEPHTLAAFAGTVIPRCCLESPARHAPAAHTLGRGGAGPASLGKTDWASPLRRPRRLLTLVF